MSALNEILIVEDLIDSDVEESAENSHDVWTEQALDLFIAQLQSVTKIKFANEREMLQVVINKMSSRSFNFTLDQAEYKYNGLKQMYNDKKQKNQEIEPELEKLFGDVKPKAPKRQIAEEEEQSPRKKPKANHSPNSSRLNKSSDDDGLFEESDKSKMIWSTASNKSFLDLLEELRPHLGTLFKTKRQMWEEIAKRLHAKGFDFTWSQIENKWKYLVRHYRNRLEMLKHENSKSQTRKSQDGPSSSKKHNKTKIKEEMEIISFANDHKLPFDDDEEDEGQFEETCSLPEINLVSPEILDPVNVEEAEIKFMTNNDDLVATDVSAKLDKISKEMQYFRKDLRKVTSQILAIKQEHLEVCKEQKEQFIKIGNTLKEMVWLLRARDEGM